MRVFVKYSVPLTDMDRHEGILGLMLACTEDARTAAEGGGWTLDAQVRAYDLLSYLLELGEEGKGLSNTKEAEGFCKVYADAKDAIGAAYDEKALTDAAKARLAPLERACTDARFEAASAASLHEFAKETYQTWQTAGIFMRKRALKALRDRAGFRLESHRIGNYVAKTFDLMNEAQMKFARAQQKMFSSDMTYKIREGLVGKIAEFLSVSRV